MEEVDSLTFARWIVFNRVDPEALQRADYQHAQLMTLLWNVNRSTESSPKAVADFLLDPWGPEMEAALDSKRAAELQKRNHKMLLAGLSQIPGVRVVINKPELLK
jgi:hypothetical protein